jgi:hypothetical protein
MSPNRFRREWVTHISSEPEPRALISSKPEPPTFPTCSRGIKQTGLRDMIYYSRLLTEVA